jgi:hypothetical protein
MWMCDTNIEKLSASDDKDNDVKKPTKQINSFKTIR